MLHPSGKWIRWDEEDVVTMTRIIGPDQAAKGYTANQDVLLYAAKKAGIQLEKSLRKQLCIAKKLRQGLRTIRQQDDTFLELSQMYESDLWAHQRTGLEYLEHAMTRTCGFLIADDVGIGKTAIAIRFMARRGNKRNLVVTPNRAKWQWARAIRRWSDPQKEITILDGTTMDQMMQGMMPTGWIIAHWEALVHAGGALIEHPWDGVILDEVQWMANRKVQRAETAFQLKSTWRMALTAHPYVNSPDEIYSLLHFLRPEEYRSFWRFWSMHVSAVPKLYGGYDILGVRDTKQFKWELEGITIRRTRREIHKNLPLITRTPVHASLPKKARREYERLRKELFVELEGLEETKVLFIQNVLARTTRIRQYLVDPGLIGAAQPSLKYPLVAELLRDVEQPIVIFTSFRQAAMRLRTYLKKDFKTGWIAGRQSAKYQRVTEKRFHHGDLNALIVVTKAGGEALNLGRYGYVTFLDLPWTPKTLEQAEGRVDRPIEGSGEYVKTTAYRIIIRDTYEARQEELLQNKHSMFTQGFTPAHLKELFT